MSSEALGRYRKLEDELVRTRWLRGGHPSPEADRLLQEMDQVWWELEEQEQTYLWSEPQRSFLAELVPNFAALVKTAERPTPASLLSAALLHDRIASELLAKAPEQMTAQQKDYLLHFGPACARRAAAACAPVEQMLGTTVSAEAIDLAMSFDSQAHRYDPGALKGYGEDLAQALAAAKEEVDQTALELIASGQLSKEGLSC